MGRARRRRATVGHKSRAAGTAGSEVIRLAIKCISTPLTIGNLFLRNLKNDRVTIF